MQYVRTDDYYDLHVPGEEHYLADGVWSHNTGKTRGLCEWANFMCEEYPGIRVLFLRKTKESLAESVLDTFENHVL